MSEIRETRKKGISWSNKNNIREFPYGSMVGQAIVNSTRPSQPGPLIELRERTFNPVRNAGLTLRPLGVKQTAPIVPDLPRNNMRRNTNKAWKIANKVMRMNKRTNYRPLSKTEFNSAVQGYYNEEEAKKSQANFENPLIPHSTPSTNEPWYKHMLPSQAYGPAVVGASTSPWQRLTPPVNTSDGGRRYSKKRSYTKKRSYKRSYTKKRSHKK